MRCEEGRGRCRGGARGLIVRLLCLCHCEERSSPALAPGASVRRSNLLLGKMLVCQLRFDSAPLSATDVLIVGAGPAGLAAALGLKKLGVKNVLVAERESEAGGIPRLCGHMGFGLRDLHRVLTGPSYARRYREMVEEAGIKTLKNTTITGWDSALTPGPLPKGEGDTLPLISLHPMGLGVLKRNRFCWQRGCVSDRGRQD